MPPPPRHAAVGRRVWPPPPRHAAAVLNNVMPHAVRVGAGLQNVPAPLHVRQQHRNTLDTINAHGMYGVQPGIFQNYTRAANNQFPPFGRVHLVKMANIAGSEHFMHELDADVNMNRRRVQTSRKGPFRGTTGHIKTMARSTHVVYRVVY